MTDKQQATRRRKKEKGEREEKEKNRNFFLEKSKFEGFGILDILRMLGKFSGLAIL